jgi:hypothetical protein
LDVSFFGTINTDDALEVIILLFFSFLMKQVGDDEAGANRIADGKASSRNR